MNILYISHLTNVISEGPNYSVPAQIKAQSEYDNVFWWNISEACQEMWLDTGLFHGIKEYPAKRISQLPKPFDNPDLVVFEGFYYFDYIILSKECRKRDIPYIIIPRSSLTKLAQERKKIKKFLGNLLLFRKMAKKALAIQYLTDKEYKDSGDRWCKNSFIMPNGFTKLYEVNKNFNENELKGVYIGRFEPYQKGLDLLLEACKACADYLRSNHFTINFYGPERKNNTKKEFIDNITKENLTDILIVNDSVYGEDKRKVLEKADFFIMTSRFEGMPMALIEALSFSLPCFVTAGTNMADEINGYDAGWTCETNAYDIARAIKRMISEKNEFIKKSKNAVMLAKNYEWGVIAEKTHKIYVNYLDKKRDKLKRR